MNGCAGGGGAGLSWVEIYGRGAGGREVLPKWECEVGGKNAWGRQLLLSSNYSLLVVRTRVIYKTKKHPAKTWQF